MIDITEAVHGLAIFRENWCWNEKIKMFNCDFCEFCEENGKCSLKGFVYGHKHDYPIEKFKGGSK